MDDCRNSKSSGQPSSAKTKLESHLDKLRDGTNNSWQEKQAVLDYLRRHVRRHPSDGDKLVEAGGVALLMNLLMIDIGSHSPSPPFDHTTLLDPVASVPLLEAISKHAELATAASSAEEAPAISTALHLLSYLTNSSLGRSALTTEQSLRTFLRCMGCEYGNEGRSYACRSLANLLSTSAIQRILSYQHKLIAEVVTALKGLLSFSASAQCHAVAIRTARQTTSLKRDLIRAGFVAAVGSVLVFQDDVEVLQHALSCMTTFANELASSVNKEKGIITPMINEKDRLMLQLARENRAFIPRLITLTSHETPGIQQSALDLLCLLSTNGIRGDMGSNGVMACFLEHLGFDEGQTTVSTMQKKLVYALTMCCHDGYNRVRLNDLGGISVLLSVLGSPLYSSVHLHILSCLPEFRHDEQTLENLIKNGVVPLATKHFLSAMQILFPLESKINRKSQSIDTSVMKTPQKSLRQSVPSESNIETPQALPGNHTTGETPQSAPSCSSTKTPQAVTFSASSPSYQAEVMASSASLHTPLQNKQWPPTVSSMLDSPVFSPPSLPQELRYGRSPVRSMWSGGVFSPDQFSAQSSPASDASPSYGGSSESYGGRYSPVLQHGLEEEPMDTDSRQVALVTSVASLGLDNTPATTQDGSPVKKRKLSEEATENAPSKISHRRTNDKCSKQTNNQAGENMGSKWSKRDAEKVMDYVMAFFGAISYRNELAPSLTSKATLSALNTYLCQAPPLSQSKNSSQAAPDDAGRILAHIIRSHLCFQPLIRHGLPLMLYHPHFIEVNFHNEKAAKKAEKTALLRQMRSQAESHFGFGELLHLCKRSALQVRATCMAGAALLLQTRSDRRKFFDKEKVLAQLMEVAVDVQASAKERALFAQALHGFFLEEYTALVQQPENTSKSFPECREETSMECCEYSDSLVGLEASGEATLRVDDGQYLVVQRQGLAAASEVFGAMLATGHFMEGQSDSVVVISETSIEALSALVHHLLGCHREACPLLQATFHQGLLLLDIIQLSDQYLAFELKEAALKELIQRRLNAENIAVIYGRSVERQLSFVAEDIIKWILTCPDVSPFDRAANLDALLTCPYGSSILDEIQHSIKAQFL